MKPTKFTSIALTMLLAAVQVDSQASLLDDRASDGDLTYNELLRRSESVEHGTVTRMSSYREENGVIYTDVTLEVIEHLKAGTGKAVTFTTVGGTVGDSSLSVSIAAQFRLGEEVVVFLEVSLGNFAATETEESLPIAISLEQNYPNPFNPDTFIGFHLAAPTETSLEIYNALGQKIAVPMASIALRAGTHRVRWDGRDSSGELVSAGTYLYRVVGAGIDISNRMTLVK